MKKKALPVGTMFLVLVIALAAVGVGYVFALKGYWTNVVKY